MSKNSFGYIVGGLLEKITGDVFIPFMINGKIRVVTGYKEKFDVLVEGLKKFGFKYRDFGVLVEIDFGSKLNMVFRLLYEDYTVRAVYEILNYLGDSEAEKIVRELAEKYLVEVLLE